ncbi:MAG: hypothetical protein AAF543_08520, partial [Pseudomonadota bacterium]
RAVLRGHEGGVLAVAVTPDGQQVVSGSLDNTVRVFDLASGEERAVLRGHEGGVLAVAVTPDGQQVVSGSGDRTVRVTWVGSSKKELIERARERLPREMTDEEKRRFYIAVD